MSNAPPLNHDPAAELAVLGSMLARNQRIPEVAATLKPEDFFDPRHQVIMRAMLALDAAGSPIDSITLATALMRDNLLMGVGGLAYLAELDTAGLMAANVMAYAEIVSELALKRRAESMLQKHLMSSRAGAKVSATLGNVQADLVTLDAPSKKGDLEPVAGPILRMLDMVEGYRTSPAGSITGLATGIHALDLQLTGFHEGELIILAARPGVGKSAASMQWAVHAARHAASSDDLKRRGVVAVFSLEMPSEQLTMRMVSSEAEVSLRRLREGGLSDHDMMKLNSVCGDIHGLPLHIDDSGHLNLYELRSRVQRLIRRAGPIRLVVIDYLQLMSGSGDAGSREQEVGQISRGLKQLAKEMKCPILALAQLNRDSEKRKGGKPQLSDLRESGSLEQDADVVLFLSPNTDEGEEQLPSTHALVDLTVAKQRNGPIGVIALKFNKEHVKFTQAAEY